MFHPLLLATLLHLSALHASLLHPFFPSSASPLLHPSFSPLSSPFFPTLSFTFPATFISHRAYFFLQLFHFSCSSHFPSLFVLFCLLCSFYPDTSLFIRCILPIFIPTLSIPLSFSISSLHSLSGGMPPTPQAVQIGGQNQNQQQYDPSKGPPVQNAASLHTPPPQLPGRLPQATLPMATLPLALSQAQPVVLEQQCQAPGGQLQAQVKLQGAGAVLAAVNPHPQLQMQLQIQQQQQPQQTQPVMQPGQAVSREVLELKPLPFNLCTYFNKS